MIVTPGTSGTEPRGAPAMHAMALRLRPLGIDTQQEHVIYMRRDCHVCRADGFKAQTRLEVALRERRIIATLSLVDTDLLAPGEASVSIGAWHALRAAPGDSVTVTHAPTLDSLSAMRAKIYGHRLDAQAFDAIVGDVAAGRYSGLHLAAFVGACAGGRLNLQETIDLTRAMVGAGERIAWGARRSPTSIALEGCRATARRRSSFLQPCSSGLPQRTTCTFECCAPAASSRSAPAWAPRSKRMTCWPCAQRCRCAGGPAHAGSGARRRISRVLWPQNSRHRQFRGEAPARQRRGLAKVPGHLRRARRVARARSRPIARAGRRRTHRPHLWHRQPTARAGRQARWGARCAERRARSARGVGRSRRAWHAAVHAARAGAGKLAHARSYLDTHPVFTLADEMTP